MIPKTGSKDYQFRKILQALNKEKAGIVGLTNLEKLEVAILEESINAKKKVESVQEIAHRMKNKERRKSILRERITEKKAELTALQNALTELE